MPKGLAEITQKGPVVVLEVRSYRVADIAWKDKKTGQPREMAKAIYACEFGSGDQAKVRLRTPDGVKADKLPSPEFKRGDKVVCQVERMVRDGDDIEISGPLVRYSGE